MRETRRPNGINPVLAGLMVDLVNIPLAGLPGFVAGAAVGYWAASTHGLGAVQKTLMAIAAGWYCGLPLPRAIPVATLVGLILYIGSRSRR